ncbi:hypothetical protein PHET_00724 [Paragonimus heterotremus]|uniref:Uncharacterized protein n=1 Tax=Paragonimus heterotremus TaxID=100268 RepID=A0A8J4T4I4_9TREM|nr:hypothetical protein PHET_00724 [Paragonimus heterotremus]
MGDKKFKPITNDNLQKQFNKTQPSNVRAIPTPATVAATDVDNTYHFLGSLDSPYLVTPPSCFRDFSPRLDCQTSPPVGRTSFPFIQPESPSTLLMQNESGRTDSGFSSWTANSDLHSKISSTPDPEKHIIFDSEREQLSHGTHSHVNSPAFCQLTHGICNRWGYRALKQGSSGLSRSTNQGPDLSALPCANALNEELTDRMLIRSLAEGVFPNLSLQRLPTASEIGNQVPSEGLDSVKLSRVRDTDSSMCSRPQVNILSDQLVSPHSLSNKTYLSLMCSKVKHRRPISAPMHPDAPLQTAICSGDVHPDESTSDQDGDDESERQAPHFCIPRRLRRTRRYSCHVSHSATGHAQPATRPHPGSPQLFLPHSSFLPRTRGLATETTVPRDAEEPLWFRRRCRFEPLTIAATSRTVNTQSIGAEGDLFPSVQSQHPATIMPDVVPRHICPIRPLPVVCSGTNVAATQLVQPRCSSVPLAGSTDNYPFFSPCGDGAPLTSVTSGTMMFRARGHIGQFHRISDSAGTHNGPTLDHTRLSILARRMADIGDELEASYFSIQGRFTTMDGLSNNLHRQTRTGSSLWTFSSSLVNLVTSPLDCVHRLFQLASRSLSNTSPNSPLLGTRPDTRAPLMRRRRTETYAGILPARCGLYPDGTRIIQSQSQLSNTARDRLSVGTSTPRHRSRLHADSVIVSVHPHSQPHTGAENPAGERRANVEEVFNFDEEDLDG